MRKIRTTQLYQAKEENGKVSNKLQLQSVTGRKHVHISTLKDQNCLIPPV